MTDEACQRWELLCVEIYLLDSRPTLYHLEKLLVHFRMGAVHKVCHAIFGQFLLPSPCHTFSHIPGPPKVRHTSRTPPRFLVGLVQKTQIKTPCTNSLSIVFVQEVLSGGLLSGRFCPGWFLSVPPSVRMHMLQQKVKHHFKFHVSYVR